jgi:hypothetical protein
MPKNPRSRRVKQMIRNKMAGVWPLLVETGRARGEKANQYPHLPLPNSWVRLHPTKTTKTKGETKWIVVVL